MFWLILSVLLWGFLHSLFASLQAKELTRRWFGERMGRFHRLAYNIFSAVSFLPVLAIAALTPDRTLYRVPLPWSGVMIFGELLTVAALVVGFLQTDVWEFIGLRQVAGPLETREGKLVTLGLYRYVRHPLYSAGIAFIWLMPLMTVNVLAINIALTVYVVIGAMFEERKLRREFGQEYADYAARTPMFIPFTKWNKK
jgi:protein-S-isoprenylcysteine O-methyltransferase Ste14